MARTRGLALIGLATLLCAAPGHTPAAASRSPASRGQSPATSDRREAARATAPSPVPAPKRPAARNEIRNFRAASLSGTEMEVTVDYAYVGDHGAKDVFLHAMALQSDDRASRVPGTSFPDAAIHVGDGSVTIHIRKLPDTPRATSSKVRICMVSLPYRTAFACRTFECAKAWE